MGSASPKPAARAGTMAAPRAQKEKYCRNYAREEAVSSNVLRGVAKSSALQTSSQRGANYEETYAPDAITSVKTNIVSGSGGSSAVQHGKQHGASMARDVTDVTAPEASRQAGARCRPRQCAPLCSRPQRHERRYRDA